MNTKIISIINQKGGPGKTTITMQLAGTLCLRGHSVLVVDGDKQGTATRWSSSASEESPFPASISNLSGAGNKIHQEIKKFISHAYDFVLIDCPPAVDSQVGQSALLISDLAIIPIVASPPDLWASVPIRQVVENAQTINEDLKSLLVVNRLQANTTLSKEVLDILPDFGIPIAKTRLHLRTVYGQSALFGVSVQHFKSKAKAAISEMEQLTDEVLALLS